MACMCSSALSCVALTLQKEVGLACVYMFVCKLLGLDLDGDGCLVTACCSVVAVCTFLVVHSALMA